MGLRRPFRQMIARRRARREAARLAAARPDRVRELAPAELLGPPFGAIGVMAHVFYLDLADELVRYLRNVPAPFALLVSIGREEDRPALEAKLRALSGARVVIRTFPNRGRNIAPLLVGFRDEAQKLDLLCHVHTKRSMFGGAWRRHMYQALLGSPERVRAILALFQSDPALGVVQPASYGEVTYCSESWLGNQAAAAALLDRLGMTLDPFAYPDFPAGSMFWARREALRPLWDLALRFEDFPEEAGQQDGALQHAVERCFVLAARSAGLSHRVVEDVRRRHRFHDADHKNLHEYFAQPITSRILRAGARAEVVSFDLFDTLVLRPFTTPGAVVQLAAERIARELGIPDFAELREAAVASLRRERPTGDLGVEAIHSEIRRARRLPDTEGRRCLELEVEAWTAHLVPRAAVAAAARSLRTSGKRVVVVADTCLRASDVAGILGSAAIGFDALYVSGELSVAKEDGSLWDAVLRRERVKPKRFLHVGDDDYGDVLRVLERHGRSVHVMRPVSLLTLLDEERRVLGAASRSWREDLRAARVANALACLLDDTPRERERLLGAGALAGPCSPDPEGERELEAALLGLPTRGDGAPALADRTAR